MTARRGAPGPEDGQILPLFALMLTLLLLPVAGLAVDGGLVLARHASLVGTAQAAAEAGSQAVDQTWLSRTGGFRLCTSPDGGPDCGNGVGSVLAVVEAAVASSPGPRLDHCQTVGQSQLRRQGRAGCRLALLGSCGAGVATGVRVLLWEPARLPLLGLGPLGGLTVSAASTSWLAHGPSDPGVPGLLPQC